MMVKNTKRIRELKDYIAGLKKQLSEMQFGVTSVSVDGVSVTYDAEKLAKEIHMREMELSAMEHQGGTRTASLRVGNFW